MLEGYGQVYEKEIIGFPDYIINMDGEIYSKITGKFLKINNRLNGYSYVELRGTTCALHRLMAKSFIPNPLNKRTVNHKNGIKHDYRLENLEWCTYSENTIHGFNVLGRKPTYGMKGKFGRQAKKVIQIKDGQVIKIWNSTLEARKNGFSNVSDCCRGTRAQDKGFQWKFLEN